MRPSETSTVAERAAAIRASPRSAETSTRLRVSIVSIAVSIALAIVGHSADVGRHGRFEGKHFNPGQLIPAKLSG